MFWKKKPPAKHQVRDPDTENKRQTFRINPETDQPVVLTVGSTDILAANISSGGVAFRARGFQLGKRYSVRLQLPGDVPPIHTRIEVIECDDRCVCRCHFLELSAMSKSLIQQYVLDREKQQIRTTRTRRIVTDEDVDDEL